MQIADKFSIMMNFKRNIKVHLNCKLKSILYPEEKKENDGKRKKLNSTYVMFNSLTYIYNVCFINCYFCGNINVGFFELNSKMFIAPISSLNALFCYS